MSRVGRCLLWRKLCCRWEGLPDATEDRHSLSRKSRGSSPDLAAESYPWLWRRALLSVSSLAELDVIPEAVGTLRAQVVPGTDGDFSKQANIATLYCTLARPCAAYIMPAPMMAITHV